jgi:hydrogenase nickel incorporation protein HypA/HybF
MHELSVCESLMRQVEAIAAQHSSHSVCSITLQIGPLAGIEPHLLQQAFTLARAGSVAEQASLVIESLPIRVHCQRCDQDSEAQPNRLLCAHCGDYHTRLLSGDEMLLASVELANVADAHAAATPEHQHAIPGGKHV